MSQQKTTPHNINAEESVLGAVLIDDKQILPRVRAIVSPAEFYLQKHAMIYRAMLDLEAGGEAVDFLTLTFELERRNQLEEVGGAAYVTGLINAVPMTHNAESYARSVADTAERRRHLQAASEIAQLVHKDIDQHQFRAKARAALRKAENRRALATAMGAADAVDVLRKQAVEWAADPLGPGEVRGMSTGLVDLDDMMDGLGTGLYLVGAVQHTGKTALCQQLVRNVAAGGGRALMFSLEHTDEYMWYRFACSEAKIDIRELRRGLDQQKLARFNSTLEHMRGWGLEVVGEELTLAQMENEIQARQMNSGLDIVVIDNLEISARDVDGEKDYIKFRNTAYWMLRIAANNDIPLFTTMQIGTKMVARRPDNRPDISDLYGSDGPAQAASAVLLLHRPDRWTFNEREKTNTIKVECWKDKVFFTGTGRGKEFQFGDQGQVRDLERRAR